MARQRPVPNRRVITPSRNRARPNPRTRRGRVPDRPRNLFRRRPRRFSSVRASLRGRRRARDPRADAVPRGRRTPPRRRARRARGARTMHERPRAPLARRGGRPGETWRECAFAAAAGTLDPRSPVLDDVSPSPPPRRRSTPTFAERDATTKPREGKVPSPSAFHRRRRRRLDFTGRIRAGRRRDSWPRVGKGSGWNVEPPSSHCSSTISSRRRCAWTPRAGTNRPRGPSASNSRGRRCERREGGAAEPTATVPPGSRASISNRPRGPTR